MYNEPRRDFFFLLIISALLHLVMIVIILLSKIDDSVKEYKNVLLKAKEKKEKSAQVIFQQPPEKKQEPKKKMAPIFTSGNAASAPAAPAPEPQQPALSKPITKPEQPEPDKEQEKPEKPPHEQEKKRTLEEKKEAPKQLKHPEQKTTKTIEPKQKPEKSKKQPSPQPVVEKKPQQPEKKKKLTLADIAKGFMSYARNTMAPPSNSNHVVTVIGTQAGQATEEQLRYERYAAKLFQCIQTSLTVLLRTFRFIHKPDVQNLALNFVMAIDAKGNITGLTIRQGTGNQQFDTFMIKVLHHASKSFPPLPTYFGTDVCSFPIIYTIPVRAIQIAALSQQVAF